MPPPQLQSAPQEDISVVMGRFHAWDSARQKPPATNAATEDVRELSYEEALAYSSPKRPVRSPLPPIARTASEQDASGAAMQAAMQAGILAAGRPAAATTASQQKSQAANEASRPLPSRTSASDPTGKARAKSKTASKPASVTTAAPADAATTTRRTARKPATPRKAASTRKAASKAEPAAPVISVNKLVRAKSHNAVRGHSRRSRAKPPVRATDKPLPTSAKAAELPVPPSTEARQASTFQGALAACLKESPRRSAAAKTASAGKSATNKRPARTKAETRAASSQADKTVPRKPVESIARTISVNLRLSKAEHDRMRRGAAEADMSLATFIRESTLRYQIGRERDQKSMKELHGVAGAKRPGTSGHAEISDDDSLGHPVDRAMVESEGPSLLMRMKNFWLGRRLTAVA